MPRQWWFGLMNLPDLGFLIIILIFLCTMISSSQHFPKDDPWTTGSLQSIDFVFKKMLCQGCNMLG